MGRHDKTLNEIFAMPTRADVRWPAFVGLVQNKGGTVAPGAGSRFRLELKGARMVIHRPHPGDVMSKGQVESCRAFLAAAGLDPAATPLPSPAEEEGDQP